MVTNARKSAIVLYHFVHNAEETPYSFLLGPRRVEEFAGQVEYLCRYHQPLCLQDFVDFYAGKCDLPADGFYLTFDDGFRDHLEFVLPIVEQHSLEAAFYPMMEPLVNRRVPNVEKVRFLTSSMEIEELIQEFTALLFRMAPETDRRYFAYDAQQDYTDFDESRVGYFKILLTRRLPIDLVNLILDIMFQDKFGPDEDLIRELYMSWEEIKILRKAGMVIGGHTITHPWLPTLGYEEQKAEICGSLDLLREKLGEDIVSFAYPYGGFDDSTLKIMRSAGCSIGFTATANVLCAPDKPYEIDRLDTNDLPLSKDDAPNKWSQSIGIKD
jgi:peptidoglycan/xylan/chitin deacetylase (PgdA/CDA1 family)